MKVALIYVRVVKKCEPSFQTKLPYEPSTVRFYRTYMQFRPKIPHDLIVVNCGGEQPDRLFDEVATSYERYDGLGYDCGTYQAIATNLDHDLVMCLNTHAYFWRDAWLERFVVACERHGQGVYGATGSFQHHPHLRTPAIAFTSGPIRSYPDKVNSRQKCNLFEFGPRNFTLNSMSMDYSVRVVACAGTYYLYDSDKINNGFMHGDQSNILIRDRHTDLFNGWKQEMRDIYTKGARTLENGFPDDRLNK